MIFALFIYYYIFESNYELSELPDPSYLDFMVKQRYPSKFHLKDYDFYIIFVDVRLEANINLDNWLINFIRNEYKKPYFLVKSKVGIICSHYDQHFLWHYKYYDLEGFASAQQIILNSANEETKNNIRRETYDQLKATLAEHYPQEKVYLTGRETINGG